MRKISAITQIDTVSRYWDSRFMCVQKRKPAVTSRLL